MVEDEMKTFAEAKFNRFAEKHIPLPRVPIPARSRRFVLREVTPLRDGLKLEPGLT